MAERPIIRKGDPTTHGGVVLEGFEQFDIYGKPAAGVGHKVSCPLCPPGVHVIAEGCPGSEYHGIQLSVEGMLTSCGAALISTQFTALLDAPDGAGVSFAVPAGVPLPKEAAPEGEKDYDQHFHLLDEQTGEALANRRYRITVNGVAFEGRTDGDGKTRKVGANAPHDVTIEVFAEGD
ncbi:MAG: PAAR domain-containing protein [Burkholderiaceae bacterium]|jgi:uncharacterized Zn-binding protein involved in type VI secretion|nr:PAAR domain-containing protein [Burkholderiaceae bacterium]